MLAIYIEDGKISVLDEVEADESGEARLSWQGAAGVTRSVSVRLDEIEGGPEPTWPDTGKRYRL